MVAIKESIFSYLTRADKFLISVLLVLSFFSYAMVKSALPRGSYAVVSVDNQEVARIKLEQGAGLYDFQSAVGPIVVERKNGQVSIVEASCPNKICQKMGWIDAGGGMIVCAPGKVLIQITGNAGEGKSDIDAITR